MALDVHTLERQITPRGPDEQHAGYLPIPAGAISKVIKVEADQVQVLPGANLLADPADAYKAAGQGGIVLMLCKKPAGAEPSQPQSERPYQMHTITAPVGTPYDTWRDDEHKTFK